jgi:hypothetical protein
VLQIFTEIHLYFSDIYGISAVSLLKIEVLHTKYIFRKVIATAGPTSAHMYCQKTLVEDCAWWLQGVAAFVRI